MTAERDLLNAWLCIAPHIVDPMYEKLHKTTKELLAQPEQEPVAWMYDWNIIEEEEYGETRYDNLTRAESITKSRAITNVRPLYLAPPKREPLSDEILYPIAEARINDEGIAGFYDGFRYAEKHHGIGE